MSTALLSVLTSPSPLTLLLQVPNFDSPTLPLEILGTCATTAPVAFVFTFSVQGTLRDRSTLTVRLSGAQGAKYNTRDVVFDTAHLTGRGNLSDAQAAHAIVGQAQHVADKLREGVNALDLGVGTVREGNNRDPVVLRNCTGYFRPRFHGLRTQSGLTLVRKEFRLFVCVFYLPGPDVRGIDTHPALVRPVPVAHFVDDDLRNWASRRTFPEASARFEAGNAWPSDCFACEQSISGGWNHVCMLNSTNQAACFGGAWKENQLVPKGYVALH